MLVIRHPEWTDASMASFRHKSVRKMSTKQHVHTHTEATDSKGPKGTVLGVDCDRVIPKGGNDCSTEAVSTNLEQPKVIRMGIDLARKLFHCSRDDEHFNSPRRVDHIFDVHATNEEHTLHRRRTMEDFKRQVKLNVSKIDISKPSTSPPAPDETLMHRYEKRQADWKKRSISMKSKGLESVKRWSLKTWKGQSGREDIPNVSSLGSSDTGETKKLSPRNPIREPEELNSLGPFARERVRRIRSLQSAGLEISIKPVPISSRNEATTFRDQKRNPLTSPTKLDAIDEQPSQRSRLHPTHSRAATATRVPRQHNLGHQVLTKSASTGMLRPGKAHDSDFDIPSLSRTISTNDQRYVHPALRAQRSAILSANDQRHIHPALRTQPCPSLSASDQRHIHPALRNESSLRPTTIKERQIQPVLRAQPSTNSMASCNAIKTTGSAPPVILSAPRVRIIPPTPSIGPNDRPTVYAERAILASRPPTSDEQRTLVENINTARAAASAAPLDLHPLLSNRAQDFVTLTLPPLPPPKPTPTAFRRHASLNTREARQRATQIEPVEFLNPSGGASAIRLISPPGLGALACAELWAGGKYKRHKTVNTSQVLERHRYTLLPKFETDDVASMIPMVSPGHGHSHSQGHNSLGWCVCAEYDAWLTITDKRWEWVGIGCAEDGRWVVELWQPVAGATRGL